MQIRLIVQKKVYPGFFINDLCDNSFKNEQSLENFKWEQEQKTIISHFSAWDFYGQIKFSSEKLCSVTYELASVEDSAIYSFYELRAICVQSVLFCCCRCRRWSGDYVRNETKLTTKRALIQIKEQVLWSFPVLFFFTVACTCTSCLEMHWRLRFCLCFQSDRWRMQARTLLFMCIHIWKPTEQIKRNETKIKPKQK